MTPFEWIVAGALAYMAYTLETNLRAIRTDARRAADAAEAIEQRGRIGAD